MKTKDNTINENRRDSIRRILDLSKGDIQSFKALVNKEVDETENLEIKYLDIFYNIVLGQYTLLGVFTIYNTAFIVSKNGMWITPRAEIIKEFITAIHNWVAWLTYDSGSYDRESYKTIDNDMDCNMDCNCSVEQPNRNECVPEAPQRQIRNPEAPQRQIRNEECLGERHIGVRNEVRGAFATQAPAGRAIETIQPAQ